MLDSFTIYYDDEIGTYFVRRFVIAAGHEPLPREIVGRSSTLEGARSFVPPGLVPFARDAEDAPEIVETWL